jgi:hypothetical protein
MGTLTQNDAINLSIAITTAMLNGDKQTREFLYEDLDTDDLKRILRWNNRFLLNIFAVVVGPENLKEAWQLQAQALRDAAAKAGDQP